MKTDKVNRVEVIDENGRTYTNYNVKECILSLQDNNRTLKIFIKSGDFLISDDYIESMKKKT